MKRSDHIFLARLRLIVGYLGEQGQFGWWSCSFFSPSSRTFLVPVFGKTMTLAQYYGVKESATKVHDNYIGVGRGVFHLFRLPETIEQELHDLLSDSEIVKQVIRDIASRTDALDVLELFGGPNMDSIVGPVRIGGLKDIVRKDVWQVAARYYRQAFESNNQVFPFFSEG
ncbi:hypothetical protein SY88_07495 [Clostridiales bacterium PH28_bin88]|nr:hypothetical protein SY88_07495 [Clostridiales bacterium PH28_bin88]